MRKFLPPNLSPTLVSLYQVLVWCRTHHEQKKIKRRLQEVEHTLTPKGCNNPMLTPGEMQILWGELSVVKAALALAVGDRELVN